MWGTGGDLAEARVRQLAVKIGAALGASVEVRYRRGNPATINSSREAAFAASVGEKVFGSGNVLTEFQPAMTGEDFAYMLLKRPGAYIWVGQGGTQGGCFLHNSDYDFNDEIIPLGAGYLAALAEDSLPL